MASIRIAAFDQSGLELINRQLEQFDLLKKQIANLQSSADASQQRIAELQNQKQSTGANNLIFTWAGGGNLLTWAQGYVQDRVGVIYPVPAGARVSTPAQVYWMGWNPAQQQMSAVPALTQLTAIPTILVICSVRTGGADGVAGGGGTDPGGVGVIGKEYTLL